jgi:hypothetical protein
MPQWMLDACREENVNVSVVIRKALTEYFRD